jgi:DNA-binding transcriptional MerR regulator
MRHHVESLTIGEFGRRSGLSQRALRLYDVSGLLPPAAVDPVSGYRRYTADQLERARRISMLRRLDMPLTVVAEVLGGTDDEALIQLDRWWAAQEAGMQARRGSIGWLRASLGHAGAPEFTYPVARRDVPATKIAVIRTEVDQQGLVDAIRSSEWTIREHLGAAGAGTTAEHWVIYHGLVTPDAEAPIEVCVPYTGSVEPSGTVMLRVEPAHREIYATVARDDCFFPRIMHAYEAVETAGSPPAGPAREVYLNAWERIAGTDPFVLVALPVAE